MAEAVMRQPLTRKVLKSQRELIFITIPFVIYGFIFYYIPLFGWVMGFQKYKPVTGVFGSEWVGINQFKKLFTNDVFMQTVRNTLAMGIINLVLSFVFAILFALLLNEVRSNLGKRFSQTVSYLPHFLSMIIVTGIVQDVLALNTGIFNDVLTRLGIISAPINWLAVKEYFWWIVGFSNVWKETGWNSIIYIAAITSISPDLYEAASIDGAGRLRKIWNITLPSLKPTIFILMIINIGNILNVGFEIQYLLGNGIVQSVSQTIDIYVLKYGISQGDYSLGTAAGIFKSVVSIILILLANAAAKAADEERLF